MLERGAINSAVVILKKLTRVMRILRLMRLVRLFQQYLVRCHSRPTFCGMTNKIEKWQAA